MENLIKAYGWVALGLVAALSAAGVTIFGSIGLEKVNPTLATTLRSIIMMITLVVVSLLSGQLQTLWRGGSNMDSRAWPSSFWPVYLELSPGWPILPPCSSAWPARFPRLTAECGLHLCVRSALFG